MPTRDRRGVRVATAPSAPAAREHPQRGTWSAGGQLAVGPPTSVVGSPLLFNGRQAVLAKSVVVITPLGVCLWEGDVVQRGAQLPMRARHCRQGCQSWGTRGVRAGVCVRAVCPALCWPEPRA